MLSFARTYFWFTDFHLFWFWSLVLHNLMLKWRFTLFLFSVSLVYLKVVTFMLIAFHIQVLWWVFLSSNLRTPVIHSAVLKAPGMDVLKVSLSTPQEIAHGVSVWEWSGSALDEGADASKWFSDYLGKPSRLVRFNAGRVYHCVFKELGTKCTSYGKLIRSWEYFIWTSIQRCNTIFAVIYVVRYHHITWNWGINKFGCILF